MNDAILKKCNELNKEIKDLKIFLDTIIIIVTRETFEDLSPEIFTKYQEKFQKLFNEIREEEEIYLEQLLQEYKML